MKTLWKRIVFTVMFSLFATATASVFMYLLPVLYYIGYQTQIPAILIGYALGALLFSIAGTLVALFAKKPILYGLVSSVLLAAALSVAYRLTGVTTDNDLILGALASQSFALFYATMFQYFQSERRKILAAGISVAAFTLLNITFFLATALIYLYLGQAYLPNIVVYLEVICGAIGAIALVLFFNSKAKPQAP